MSFDEDILNQSLEVFFGEGDFLGKKLKKLGVTSVADLIEHYPRRYEDRSMGDDFPRAPSEVAVEACGIVLDMSTKFWGGRKVFELIVASQNDGVMHSTLLCRWFNMPFLAKQFAVGQEVSVFGVVKLRKKQLLMDHPEYEILDSEEESRIHTGRIVPVYPTVKGVSQRLIRKAIHQIIALLPELEIADLLPEPSAKGPFSGMNRKKAMSEIHFPSSEQKLEQSRRYLALEEFVALQMKVLRNRVVNSGLDGIKIKTKEELLIRFYEGLPFTPTKAQTRAIDEIRVDLGSEQSMSRLLQGDVGSGKTLVAVAAILLCVEAEEQALLMAPTQILAEQHYMVLKEWLEPLGIKIALRTGSKKVENFLPLLEGSEDIQVFVGTHALLFEEKSIDRPGLVIIDEQHRFGVEQRAKLIDKGNNPHVLVMTATPIPRTLTLSFYGDLDVSILDERPNLKGEISTYIRKKVSRSDVGKFIKSQVEEGRQAYVVYPLVEDSDQLNIASVISEFPLWKKSLSPIKVGLLHGRMSADEKEDVMNRYRSNEFAVLVSTTVIEVGIDVPNASVMVIYHAERFGLAQLHQLRGRIGRGEHKSFCILMTNKDDPESLAKLEVLEKHLDGFKVAEADLIRRGPGDVLGKSQSGLSSLKMGDLITDIKLVEVAKKLATKMLKSDPDLEKIETQVLFNRFDHNISSSELQ